MSEAIKIIVKWNQKFLTKQNANGERLNLFQSKRWLVLNQHVFRWLKFETTDGKIGPVHSEHLMSQPLPYQGRMHDDVIKHHWGGCSFQR